MELVISAEALLSGGVSIVLENSAWPGVKTISDVVASDFEMVFGDRPAIQEISGDEEISTAVGSRDNSIIVGTIGRSSLLDELSDSGLLDLDVIRDKRECYIFKLINRKDEPGYTSLVIAGSDKRGTIYGLFHLSELLGVSPLVKWNGVVPMSKGFIKISDEDDVISKEPSVVYRGFFINDEWPAFGNWCNEHFGGFTAECYSEIFEMLLRLKGNYIWPAMWSAVFSEDGPGLANVELADELGVIVGMSHHEPCMRNGEEYSHVRGPQSIYGDAWNFRSNEAGITRFWEDGLKRNGQFENVITVGMRGEADSTIMGEDSTLKDNIDLLRDVLRCQNRLIRENVNENLDEVPRMLALYKEVEPFYYGDDKTEGLMHSEELDGVTLMLCDDNFGNLRTVPTKEMMNHKGGFGMYYHFDYHGWPISYEWVNSSYLPKIWEQMTQAYEFGIRQLWIVNVGDVFSTEYPLSFFLDLAYDYDKWGISNIDAPREYTKMWTAKQFAGRVDKSDLDGIEDLLISYSKIASSRRPEAMNPDVYSPKNDEALNHIRVCEELMEKANQIRTRIPNKSDFAYFQFVYYPLMGNLNVHKLWCETTMNHYMAGIGATQCSEYADRIRKSLQFDRDLIEELHTIADGRWYGMGMSQHIGFKHWNEEECLKPVIYDIEPADKNRIIAVIPETLEHTEGGDWTGRELKLKIGNKEDDRLGNIRLYSACAQDASFQIESDNDNIRVSCTEGYVKGASSKDIKVYVDDNSASAMIKGHLIIKTQALGKIKIDVESVSASCDMTKYDQVVLEAGEGIKSKTGEERFVELPEYGLYKSALKVIPPTKTYEIGKGPQVTYEFDVQTPGTYKVKIYMAPCNPPYMDQKLYYGFIVGDGRVNTHNAVPDEFRVGDHQQFWQDGVLANIRVMEHEVACKPGRNSISIQAITPGLVIERVVITK